MSSLAFSRILSAYRPVRTFKDLFHPVSSIRHLSPSTMPNDLNNAATELKPKDLWSERAKHAVDSITSQPPLNPYSGRTVVVTRSLGDSLRALDGILARNKVKYELRLTERHEKKGVKRRRLTSERWRNSFANEVRRNVQLVMKMRDRGA
ncbi:hypothetical protein Ac2012v2_001794 [Leucoagaricus gongylophorus]